MRDPRKSKAWLVTGGGWGEFDDDRYWEYSAKMNALKDAYKLLSLTRDDHGGQGRRHGVGQLGIGDTALVIAADIRADEAPPPARPTRHHAQRSMHAQTCANSSDQSCARWR